MTYYQINKDKFKKYYLDNKQNFREYYDMNVDFIRQYNKEYYFKNRKKLLEKYNNNTTYYRLNRDRIMERKILIKNYGKFYVNNKLTYDKELKKYVNIQ
jgi:hypothetical protein